MFLQADSWRGRLNSYIEDEDDDLRADEWDRLREHLQDYFNADSSPDTRALEAIEALKALKSARSKVKASVEEIFYNDVEIEVQKTVKTLVDEAVLVVEGGKPFERIGIDWACPSTDDEFSQELYTFCSAGKTLPDAEKVPWLPTKPGGEKSRKSLPRDIVKRLVTPVKIGGIEEQEDWEYSATHSSTDDQTYALFEPTYQCFRRNLKDVLMEEVQKYSSNVSTTEAIDSAVVQVAAEEIKSGNVDVDFKSLFIVPYEANQCKLVPVRDDNEGNIVTYKEIMKPGSERIVDKHLRSDPTLWTDPERPAGPKIRAFGWEPLADSEDLFAEESEAVKKRENIEAFTTDTLSDPVLESMKNRIQTLKTDVGKVLAEGRTDRKIAHPQLKRRLEREGHQFGIIPKQFESPQELLDALALPHLLEKDADQNFPLSEEIVPLGDDWLGIDGEGTHEQLTEEQYWKQLRSFKKPSSAVLVDWKAILNQEVLNDLDDAEDNELKQYFEDVSKPEDVPDEQGKQPEEDGDAQMGEKDTPARKRALDKEFLQEWSSKFGSDDGIQGLDPKNFKPPVHLVSSEEYEEKFFTHPYTSPYVFYPNFVRFRRMTRNHPTYSEYTFEKLEPAESLSPKSNLDEFKAILSELEADGPQAVASPRLIDEKNMGVDAVEAKKWDVEFNSRMTEGLSRLESYAQMSKDEVKKTEKPCKEEPSEDLLFSKVRKYEIPDVYKDFHVQPFTLEDFNSLGSTDEDGDAQIRAAEGGASDDESDDDAEPVRKTVSWRPFKKFSGYDNADVVQLLSNALQLIESSVPKQVHPPPRVVEWLEGKYQPSTSRLKKWRKMYASFFPDVDSPMRTPYLFMSEEQKSERLRKHRDVSADEGLEDPWKLTEKEKTEMQKKQNNAHTADDNLNEDEVDEGGQEKIVSLEERLGLDGRPTKKTQWAEELDTSEAPDMSVLGTPAMIFPFELDNFQKQAIMALENGYNVFVSAHTSAGKTAVAEYAIAMSRKRRSRCIYTSPIKALSNQKYKDFKRNFDTVGLITGDVQLNESSDCLIMTTEILRSMLYNSSEGIRDLEFVVLDEVHYMNDRERGHVWEEVLILLPANVQIVMLSATVPNTMEFASWVGRLKQRKVMVCRTQHRPVPLMHYFYVDVSRLKNVNPSAGRFLLKEGDKPLNKSEWEDIRQLMDKVGKAARDDRRNFLQNSGDGGPKQKFHGQQQQQHQNVMKTYGTGPNSNELMKFYAKKERQHWIKFIKHLKDIDWLPTIVFAFSRKKCDELAELIDLDLTTPEEKLRIVAFIKSQVNLLQPEDQNLPQINTLKKHLKRGIGVHHSGILPVLKEIVEVLFQDGIVRLLFATETFAMGVNMPARTVVFNSIDKHDGVDRRFLLPAEYIQMAGRAGRRDKDTFGNVIIRSPTRDRDRELLTIDSIESMMTGSPSTLTSQFRVSYRMILSTLTARSQISAVNMMARSYHENKAQQKLYQHKDDLRSHEELETKQRILVHSRLKREEVDNYVHLYEGLKTLSTLWKELRASQIKTNKFARETSIGKFIKFHCGPVVEKVGIVVKSSSNPPEYVVLGLQDFDRVALLEESTEEKWAQQWYDILYMLPFHPSLQGEPHGVDQDTRLLVYNIQATDIVEVYKEAHPLTEEKVNVLLRDLNLARIGGKTKSDSELESLSYRLYTASNFKVVDEALFARESDFELYQMMKSKEKSVHDLAKELIASLSRQEFIEKLGLVFKWMEITARKRNLGQLVSEETMSLYPEYTNKMEVLKTMKYVVDDSVQMKGYMAARISKFELVVTEMLTRNVIKDLTPEEVAGLMSFIVYQARVRKPNRDVDEEADEDEEDGVPYRPLLIQAIDSTKMIIREIQDKEFDKSTHSEELDNLENAFGLVNVMYSWASQMTFNSVIKMAKDFQEGMLVRWIQQLVEALKDIESAARVMGDPAVPEKIQASIKAIRRGIVFAPSLYTTL
ncbi:Antiviral helicase SKI2 [Nesidiocoris tenuis]|uniref:Antiviral helicase SKI2 n=1 Tax=Nesidiocoris tenuis TaxID=355587 RepID=A0ABN7BE59_9HEMI|nr:Antiviral helicase SKI2 [Nesidiocoris tenuis]